MTIAQWQPGTTYAPGALIVPSSQSSAATPAIANAGFESGATGWTLDASLTIANVGAQAYAGTWVLEFNTTAPSGANAVNATAIACNPGQTVTVSCMARHDTSNSAQSNIAIGVQWFNASNALISSSVGGSLPNVAYNGWQQVSNICVAPAGTASFKVLLSPYRQGVDNVMVDGVTIQFTAAVAYATTAYQATQTAPGKSGTTEPVWPATGSSVVDNQVTWLGVAVDLLVWQASPLLESGATEPTWPASIGGTVNDNGIDWIAFTPMITDTNCPNSRIAAIAANKVFVGAGDIVRFCCTNNANDWTSLNDSGYLPTGLQAKEETNCTALAMYRGNMMCFSPSHGQIWQVDPDPANMSFLDMAEGGTRYVRGHAEVRGDLYYLAMLGVRSVSISAGTGNMMAGDIGTPIDPLIEQAIQNFTGEPLGVYLPSAGQYWVVLGSDAWVFTYSPTVQIGAWAHYTMPWSITDVAILDGDLYVRASDNCVYLFDRSRQQVVGQPNGLKMADDSGGYNTNPQTYDTLIRFMYVDFDAPGGATNVVGVDTLFDLTEWRPVSGTGTSFPVNLSIGYDENNFSLMTAPMDVSQVPDRGEAGFLPIFVDAPSLSFQIDYQGDGAFEYTQLNVYLRHTKRAPGS